MSDSSPSDDDSFAIGGFLLILGALSLFNWILCAIVYMVLGGDAIGVLPSQDGFVVIGHGHRSTVSEPVWLFSLFYSGATLMVTPLVWSSCLIYGMLKFPEMGKKRPKWWQILLVCIFLIGWTIGWGWDIGSSVYDSIHDWHNLGRPAATLEHR